MSLTTLAQAIVGGLASGALDAPLALPFAIVFGLGRANLAMGAYLPDARRRAPTARALVEQLFPVLAARPDASVQQLSAGEQQMVALGRALMATPRCLVLHDPFLALAPALRARLAPALRDLAAGRGLAILAAGQHVRRSSASPIAPTCWTPGASS